MNTLAGIRDELRLVSGYEHVEVADVRHLIRILIDESKRSDRRAWTLVPRVDLLGRVDSYGLVIRGAGGVLIPYLRGSTAAERRRQVTYAVDMWVEDLRHAQENHDEG